MQVIDTNPFFCPDRERVPVLEDYIKKLWKSGDSAGALVRVRATGVPVGLGSPVYAKLDAALAGAMMGINAATGVASGAGVAAGGQKGSEHREGMTAEGVQPN